MAEIDYAYVAQFAKVDSDGTLTAVGASWTQLFTPVLPTTHRMSVAGRVRALVAEGTVPLIIEIATPGDAFKITANTELSEEDSGVHPYGESGEWVGHLFALDLQIPLVSEGLYSVDVRVSDQVRHLKFEVRVTPEALA